SHSHCLYPDSNSPRCAPTQDVPRSKISCGARFCFSALSRGGGLRPCPGLPTCRPYGAFCQTINSLRSHSHSYARSHATITLFLLPASLCVSVVKKNPDPLPKRTARSSHNFFA